MGTKAVDKSLCGGRHSDCFYHPISSISLSLEWMSYVDDVDDESSTQHPFSHYPLAGSFNSVESGLCSHWLTAEV